MYLTIMMSSFINGTEDTVKLLAIHGSIVEPQVPLHGLDLVHVGTIECEAEQVQVLPDPILVHRLWYHRAAPLYVPPKHYLKCD